MILRPCLRQSGGLLNASKLVARTSTTHTSLAQQQSRSIHHVPTIGKHDAEFKEDGVPGLLTSEAFNIAWTDSQDHYVKRLNAMLANDNRVNAEIKDLVINTAREPSQAAIFNYASMAHNNHFFFRTLSKDKTHMPEDLERHLISSFGSLDTFRSTFLSTAAAPFGPSFTWLVQIHNPSPKDRLKPSPALGLGAPAPRDNTNTLHFRILTTYSAGSPYPGAHNRLQSRDMNTENLQSHTQKTTAEDLRRQGTVQNSVGSFGAYSRAGGAEVADRSRFGGAEVVPVLCVNMWEHVWMWDWGVKGKAAFLSQWWERINWEEVWGNCETGGRASPYKI